MPRVVEIYLSEQKVSTLLEAAQAADVYEVIHGGSVGLARPGSKRPPVPETQVLEQEHPEVFTACVVTRALARKAEAQASEALTPISVQVADATHFSREVLIQEQNQDPSLAPLWKRAVMVEETWKVAAQNLTGAKERMKGQYDRKAVQCSFVPGDKVLIFTPVGRERFGTHFSGPYMVVRKVGACNYVISTPEQRQKTRLCHINLLKLYVERDSANPVGCIIVAPSDREREEPVGARLDNSRACEQLQEQLKHLLKAQPQDVMALVAAHPSLFRNRPGLTSLVEHDVDTGGVTPMKQHPYRLPPFKKEKVCDEVEYMLEIGAIEPGSGEWSSPVVLIPKSDAGTCNHAVHFMAGCRRLNWQPPSSLLFGEGLRDSSSTKNGSCHRPSRTALREGVKADHDRLRHRRLSAIG
ncbi:hypothetical protein SKAU_G00326270 [Synaphobranchus kaupii]|uniref:Integrase p58-like C-terminal domain-containing protein n=1 Tax=Synaphobranchus kaupii TaxID=118154 RepID=A0A9Q1EPT2_SYNKA|nr:hypothetical protein SKAU_G00326270 [Synaphobranchus kaupii]